MILCLLTAWGAVAVAFGIAIGQAIHRADRREQMDRLARLHHHPCARQLTPAEVDARIRDIERKWVA